MVPRDYVNKAVDGSRNIMNPSKLYFIGWSWTILLIHDIVYIPIAWSLWNFAQSTAVILLCFMQNLKVIEQGRK